MCNDSNSYLQYNDNSSIMKTKSEQFIKLNSILFKHENSFHIE